MKTSKPYERVLGDREMPGARWFEEPAVIHQSELRPLGTLTWRELEEKVDAMLRVSRSSGSGVEIGSSP